MIVASPAFAFAEDLSSGRSEMSEGPTRVEIQRDGIDDQSA
jgi:hypothetical protein